MDHNARRLCIDMHRAYAEALAQETYIISQKQGICYQTIGGIACANLIFLNESAKIKRAIAEGYRSICYMGMFAIMKDDGGPLEGSMKLTPMTWCRSEQVNATSSILRMKMADDEQSLLGCQTIFQDEFKNAYGFVELMLEKYSKNDTSDVWIKVLCGYIDEHLITTCIIIHRKVDNVGGIYDLVCDKKYRSRGYGLQMINYALQVLSDRSCTTVSILANNLSKKSFVSAGFKECPEPVHMLLSLTM